MEPTEVHSVGRIAPIIIGEDSRRPLNLLRLNRQRLRFEHVAFRQNTQFVCILINISLCDRRSIALTSNFARISPSYEIRKPLAFHPSILRQSQKMLRRDDDLAVEFGGGGVAFFARPDRKIMRVVRHFRLGCTDCAIMRFIGRRAYEERYTGCWSRDERRERGRANKEIITTD